MGNTGSSSGRGHHDETVDYGHLSPQGVYTGPNDWNHAIVTQLIVERKLAPFYRPLEDYNDDWDDEQIMAARRDHPECDTAHPAPSEPTTARVDSRDPASKPPNPAKRSTSLKEPSRCPEAFLYRGAVECPICFLYYPSNINRSRCCDQAICTECFVQIKRTEPTATHLVSDPAACPYCVQDNFGVVYAPPSWRTGIGSEGMTPPSWIEAPHGYQHNASPGSAAQKRRRKSFGHDSPEVVTTDQIRPDWEAKLAAVRAAVTRRANRRIIMRQVGDRLIPVGVTSGRVHALPTGDGAEGAESEVGSGGGSRRRRVHRSNGQSDLSHLLGQMGLGGQDLEELMVMEAMRLSLLEHEEQQRKQEEERKRKDPVGQAAEGATSPSMVAGPSTEGTTTSIAEPNNTTSSGDPTSRASHGEPTNCVSPRSRSLTPVSGQTASSSILGPAFDTLPDLPHSIERPQTPSQPAHMTNLSLPLGNGRVHTGPPSDNGEQMGRPCEQAPPRDQASENATTAQTTLSSICRVDTRSRSSDSPVGEPLVHPKHHCSGDTGSAP
ncbi:hypothetical protein F5I97DRAFT_1924181 [Phlebopus sp. FC_14]|nr:hypothetical protein F5I97DRAFT_1924181 [Phlebopus sp. FC_14]